VDRIDEILEEKPDVVLIYAITGSMGPWEWDQEGLGKIRWVKRLHLFLLDYKTYQLLGIFNGDPAKPGWKKSGKRITYRHTDGKNCVQQNN
jgi:hypothetical protein